MILFQTSIFWCDLLLVSGSRYSHFDSSQGANGDWTCAEGFAGEAPPWQTRPLDIWLTDVWKERQWIWKGMYQIKLLVTINIGSVYFDLIWFDFVCFIFLDVYVRIRRNSLWSSWFYFDTFMNLLRTSNLYRPHLSRTAEKGYFWIRESLRKCPLFRMESYYKWIY